MEIHQQGKSGFVYNIFFIKWIAQGRKCVNFKEKRCHKISKQLGWSVPGEERMLKIVA